MFATIFSNSISSSVTDYIEDPPRSTIPPLRPHCRLPDSDTAHQCIHNYRAHDHRARLTLHITPNKWSLLTRNTISTLDANTKGVVKRLAYLFADRFSWCVRFRTSTMLLHSQFLSAKARMWNTPELRELSMTDDNTL